MIVEDDAPFLLCLLVLLVSHVVVVLLVVVVDHYFYYHPPPLPSRYLIFCCWLKTDTSIMLRDSLIGLLFAVSFDYLRYIIIITG